MREVPTWLALCSFLGQSHPEYDLDSVLHKSCSKYRFQKWLLLDSLLLQLLRFHIERFAERFDAAAGFFGLGVAAEVVEAVGDAIL